MDRRGFVRACALAGAAASAPELIAQALAQQGATPRLYGRARLVDADGRPLRSKAIPVGRNLIFHYPFAGTPCFLLNLGKPTRPSAILKTTDARSYEWRGGTGANGGVVAYSAICAHKLTYPTPEISFISYRAEKTSGNRHAQVIHCCSEHSQYDPADGGRVLAGPAPQPLAAILLDYDRGSDELYAIDQAEEARPRIARLRTRRDRPDLEEAEAERGERIDVLAVLVEPGGEPDRVRELEPHRLDREPGQGPAGKPRQPAAREELERRQRELVRGFGIEVEEERAREGVQHRRRTGGQPSTSAALSRRQTPSTRPSIGRKRAL